MKKRTWIAPALLCLLTVLPLLADAQEEATNRFTFAARFGFNLSARFVGSPALPALANTRRTGDGDAFNYDDGYAYPDSSGSGDGLSWYWGYDDKGVPR